VFEADDNLQKAIDKLIEDIATLDKFKANIYVRQAQ
jgi:hypothetical protein